MPMILDVAVPPSLVARVLSPAVIFLTALSLFTFHSQPPPPSPITPVVVSTAVPRRALILSFLTLAALTYLCDGLAFVVFAVLDHDWPRHSGIPANTVTGVVAFSGLAALGAWKDIHGLQVWSLKRIKAAVAASLSIDVALSVFLALCHRGDASPAFSLRSWIHIAFPAFRVLLLVPLLFGLMCPRISYASVQTFNDLETSEPTVSTLLLPHDSNSQSTTGIASLGGDGSKYGTFRTTRSNLQRSAPVTRTATPAPSTAPYSKSESKPEISLEPSWSEIWRRIRRLTPYLWPKKNHSLQLLAGLCIIILLLGRVINLAMPLTLGKLVSILEGASNNSPWLFLLAYVGMRFLQGSGGLSAIRDCFWAPVMQYSDREMSLLSFNHLLNLSYAWHTHRKTGEILRVLDRGAAINHILELALFSIIPTFIDILVALVAFCVIFQWTVALVIFIVMFAYVAASVILTQWRTRIRRQMNERDIVTRGIHTDCLLNYETVKYFGGEEHEGQRYTEAIREYQALEYKVILSLNLLNLVQNFIITSGLLIGSYMVAYQIISGGEPHASKFIIFITYLAQLYGPLTQLGYIYRSVNQSLVDTEKLLALLNEPTEVNDKENAPPLVVDSGEIEFDNVFFSYDGRSTALNGVSFKVPKGSSVALVGESGSGKSTILRLLYRFYDLGEGQGRILIDGQDIKDVTQKSLRQAIGVVPQDSVLFNTSISYNIGYGKFGASPSEIETAAKSAQMHERIISFPDGYNTKVGERGVRLSGGEKQRVAIARTLLKNPPILLLDEATSALDTSTEKDIQKALQNLVKGRSSLSIAHRLSTIVSSDIILVLKDGQIVEQGSFKELMDIEGLFATMWADQVSSTDDPAVLEDMNSMKKEVSGFIFEDQLLGASAVPTPTPSQALELEATKLNDSLATEPTSSDLLPTQGDVLQPQLEVNFTNKELEKNVFPSPVSPSVAFPTSEETTISPRNEESLISPGLAVTFDPNVNVPPSRTGTPDLESEPKRKRISSQNFQNFQRLARKISLTTKRSSSSSLIPGFNKRDQSPRFSEDRGEGSSQANSNSPAGSIKGDDKGKQKKKDKKDKGKKGSV